MRGLVVGNRVTGRARVGVDVFHYFESLSARPEMPPLIYRWRITNILLQTLDVPSGWRAIAATNAWADDDRQADYVLECELESHERTRSRG